MNQMTTGKEPPRWQNTGKEYTTGKKSSGKERSGSVRRTDTGTFKAAGRRPAGRFDTSRMEEKKRMRRNQRIRKRIGLVFGAFVLCTGSFLAGRLTAPAGNKTLGRTDDSLPGESGMSRSGFMSTASEQDSEMSDEEKRAYVLEHPEEYPEYLVSLMESSPEALDFVYSYPEEKNQETVIDLSGEFTKGEIPLFIQWDKRWGYWKYGDDLLGLSGCGPTCLSMVYVGLTGDASMNPKVMAAYSESNGFYLENVGTSWELMGTGAEELGLRSNTISLSREAVFRELDAGRPLICSMRPGDFTANGHFIVIYGREGDELLVHDPNSPKRSGMKWSYSDLEYQIKNIWSYSVGSKERKVEKSFSQI
ncbi:C39 family peptidase [Lacrimispora sp. NSJ-141]|uniref:C39 family peptidase n=1 Tax=Lientehia hominis TaxID=2897778 RepID=A0AAP2RIR7_9FIRM|nr:C39 family peptidase [Lientehia hominis]MCD2491685.1 C39 family peptidase [Lientehia hominis]